MKQDWIIHGVVDEPLTYHTHGLNKFGSLEVEILLPISPKNAGIYLNAIGEAIQNGLKLEDGLMVEELFSVPVFFFKVMPEHGEEEVFRAVFPDEKGYFPWDMSGAIRCDEPYKSQIKFDKNKVFMCRVSDIKTVEEYGTKECSIFNGFEKRDSEYVRVLRYYMIDIGKGDNLIGISPYCNLNNGMNQFLSHLKGLYEVEDYRVVCVDLDESDPIHKEFLEWW